jgi:hypothetical protein
MNLTTPNPIILILIAGLIVAVGVALWIYSRKNRTQNLRSKFGPEYERALAEHRDRGHAESELEKREKRVAAFHIQPLRPDDRLRFAEEWKRKQSLFVDDPRTAVNHADALVQDVMRERGYPVGDFEQNAADLSVEHPQVVEHYRIAHEIAVRDSRSPASTEDLRRAMVSYHALFDDLLGNPVDSRDVNRPEVVRREEVRR